MFRKYKQIPLPNSPGCLLLTGLVLVHGRAGIEPRPPPLQAPCPRRCCYYPHALQGPESQTGDTQEMAFLFSLCVCRGHPGPAPPSIPGVGGRIRPASGASLPRVAALSLPGQPCDCGFDETASLPCPRLPTAQAPAGGSAVFVGREEKTWTAAEKQGLAHMSLTRSLAGGPHAGPSPLSVPSFPPWPNGGWGVSLHPCLSYFCGSRRKGG